MVELHVDLLMQLHRQQPAAGFHALALQASERARGRSLVELLREAHGGALQHADPTLLERERSLRRHISTKAQAQLRLASLRHTPTQQAMIAREIEELMSEYESVATELRRSNRGLASALQAEPIDVSRLQRNLLDDSTTLLEYALGSEKSFLWVVTKKSLHVYELPPRAEIESAGRTAYEQLSVADGSGDGVRQLSRMLLGPASRDLKGKRLVIVSDGVIQYLPFGALLVGSEPLIRRFEVTTLPSVSTLAVLRDAPRRSKPPKTLLVFADPVFDSEDPRVASGSKPATRAMTLMAESSSRSADDARETELERSQKDIGLARLARLPFTRREANALLSLVPADQGKAVLDFDANRQFVTGPEIGRYRFIHFATHGLLNSFRPELSGIVLSMVDENGNEQNGFLSTADVFNMSLHADLVVLSGCRTGLGREIKGEGIAGLTRAFIYAGAPRVVASLWKVNDAATAELMKRFYEGMLRPHRLSAAAALREAQISLSKEKRWSAPYYWAAFVLQGEWN
jgi:CHAT domain-containing protein